MKPLRTASRPGQYGGFAIGLIIGLLIGLALALGVALYVTKVPVPFVNKVPHRTAGQDAAEAEKNRNWNPNGALAGRNAARPGPAASGAAPPVTTTAPLPAPAPAATVAVPPVTALAAPAARPAASTVGGAARAAAATTGDRAASAPFPPAPSLPGAPPAPRLGAASAGGGAEPFTYFVQAGAYGRTEDAEQQRAKLAMLGVEGRLSEREQAGRTVHRVRIGPFDKKADADAAREKLVGSGIEATLVRVQR